MIETRQNILFVFPGQGSQYLGMGQDLCRKYATARRVYDQAGEVLGYDIAELCFHGPEDRLRHPDHVAVGLEVAQRESGDLWSGFVGHGSGSSR